MKVYLSKLNKFNLPDIYNILYVCISLNMEGKVIKLSINSNAILFILSLLPSCIDLFVSSW